MSSQSAGTARSLKAADFEAVVEIDRQITGRSRRVFFERRLSAALADPAGFLVAATESEGAFNGFAIARMQNGEFGDDRRAAVLDMLGVDPGCQRSGLGGVLLDAIVARMKKHDVHELRTQVGWHDQALNAFFAGHGFRLAPRQVLERGTAGGLHGLMYNGKAPDPEIALQRMDAGMPDHSDSGSDDFVALAHDRILVRSMTADDLAAIVKIDKALTGRDRSEYYQVKLKEVMDESGVRVSLVAEADGRCVGFIMARADYGEFGRAEAAAIIDSIGVAPGSGRHGIASALLSQLMTNLEALHVETARTTVSWDNFALLGFLRRCGFRPAQQLVLLLNVN